MVKIEGEKAYPIYSVRIEYTEDINDQNRKYVNESRILSSGRAKGSQSTTVMYKALPGSLHVWKKLTITVLWTLRINGDGTG